MTAGLTAAPSTPRTVPIVFFLWLVAAIAVGATGFLARLPFPGPQLIILFLVATAIVATTVIRSVRAWVDALPWRTLLGLHAVRLVGFVFVWLGARGVLAPMFATRAGWGDVTAALIALALIAFAIEPTRARWVYNAWNLFGLLDLIVAFSTATWVVQQGLVPGVEPLLRLPLILVPLFFVPLLAASHVVLFRRINAR
jgi:hypothetical protein